MKIEIYDDRVPFIQQQDIYGYVKKSNYRIGWGDREDESYVDCIYSSYTLDEFKSTGLYDVFKKLSPLSDLKPNVDNFERCIVNLSKCGDYYFSHAHKNEIVFLYYVNLEWKDGYAGETLFYNDDLKDAHTVSSFVPGRITIFDGEIPHTIRPQSTYGPDFRFTISYFIRKETYESE